MNREIKTCQNCKSRFVIEPEDFTFYEKIKVPPPTWCPECRLIRRLAWRNERTFYKRNCDKCKKPIISIYAPESNLIVYCSPCWWSDDWDALDYGIDFDPSKPFLRQVRDLYQKVPQMNLHGLYTTVVNSDYAHMVSYIKNCYMVTYSDYSENLIYGSFVNNSKDSMDNLMLNQCELCYESVNLFKCFGTFFSADCEDCNNVYFSKNCVGCSNCFGCMNLRNKSYHIFNTPYSKEEYERRVKELDFTSQRKISEIRQQVHALWKKFPEKYMHGWHNVEVTGDYIQNSRKVFDSFIFANAENCRFCCISQGHITDSYDFSHFGIGSSLLYESLQSGNEVANVKFTWWGVTNCQDIEYGMYIVSCNNIFGSVGLKKKQYCILNKQYSKEDYFSLREKIISQMADEYGEFFPIEMSPFGYNETTVQELFPLTREETLKRGYSWRDHEERHYEVTLKSSDLPNHIKDVKDSILKEIIGCAHEGKCNEQCATAFRIIPQELEFYRKMNLPLPRLCPNCRHYQRIKQRNPLKLWHRKCACAGAVSDNGVYQNTATHFHKNEHCSNEFETSYAPERKEIVYCEQCYQSEVI